MTPAGSTPRVIVLAGPNGAGKTTASAELLRHAAGVLHFVNADAIAVGLSAFDPQAAAMQAGRVMLEQLTRLSDARESFAFESTLASRTFRPRLERLIAQGYAFDLLFLWLPSPELSIARVATRVRLGGHHVPDDVIRRRYHRGLSNFFGLYAPIAEQWSLYDNSERFPRLVAEGSKTEPTGIEDAGLWYKIKSEYDVANAITERA